MMLLCVAAFGAFTIGFGLSRSFALSLGFLALLGAADMISVFIRNSLVQLRTPDATSALEGITRESVIRIAGDFGMPVIAKRITRDEVYTADEAFFTGTAAEVTPIRELDNRVIGAGERGPVTAKLQKAFFDCVTGKSDRYSDWLTPVAG